MPDIKKARINKELKNFSKSPPKGILLYPKDDDINNLKAGRLYSTNIFDFTFIIILYALN